MSLYETEKETQTEDRGIWRQTLDGCSHKPRDAWSPQKLEEAGGTLPWSLQREHSFDLRLLSSRTERQSVIVCNGYPRKLVQMRTQEEEQFGRKRWNPVWALLDLRVWGSS